MTLTRGWSIRPFAEIESQAWDEMVARSCSGTFLHTRRFLAYHGDRFEDLSILVDDERGRLRAVLPAARDPLCAERIISHPGSTFGGLVHDPSLRGEKVVACLEEIRDHYRGLGFTTMRYRAVPTIYHRVPAQDDLYGLFRLHARRVRCDLSATIDLLARPALRENRRSARRRAERSGVRVEADWSLAEEFWGVLLEALAVRHGAAPTHTFEEIARLRERFPSNISLVAATVEGRVVAGAVLFRAPPTLHTQYLASNDLGRAVAALDPVIEASITLAVESGCRYFDFGHSNEEDGRILNDSLYEFKVSFGAGGVIHDHFELEL